MVKVLAIASGGGHWVQLLRLRPAFEGFDVAYCSVQEEYGEQVPSSRFYAIKDVSRRNPFGFVVVFIQLLRIFLRERPQALITTGSAPALIAILISRLFGARSLWIDSIANCEQLSTSGRNAARFATKCISQWPEIARDNKLDYWGSVL
jgi:UDP-N-acetylglucosamine:LPS N-acetylglucosamine transferase